MFVDVVLPNLGFGMEEGRLVSWLKAVGSPVKKGEAIAEVESDKTVVELAATVDGIDLRCLKMLTVDRSKLPLFAFWN